jgi:hypothetical protein
MSDIDTMARTLMKITKLRNQLIGIEMKVGDEEFVSIALNGPNSSWGVFFQGVFSQGKLPTFQNIWHDFIEEVRLDMVSTRVEDSQIIAIAIIKKMR